MTSAETLAQNEVSFTGSKDKDVDMSGGTTQCTVPLSWLVLCFAHKMHSMPGMRIMLVFITCLPSPGGIYC